MKKIGTMLRTMLTMIALLFLPAIPTMAADRIVAAVPDQCTVLVNGNRLILPAYAIDGNSYFKLRDLAKALDGTKKQFDVAWDETKYAITLMTGERYSALGGELSRPEDVEIRTATLSAAKIYLDNPYHVVDCAVYNIDYCNYLKLSDLAGALDFYMAYSAANTVEIDPQAGYSVTGNKIYYSDDIGLWDEPVTGVKSSVNADLDGDGQNETAEIVVSQNEEKKWTLVYKDGDVEASVPVFKGKEYGYVASIAAGHIVSENTIDFLISVNLRSMPFGGSDYELYSFQDGAFTPIDVAGITAGTEFDVSVNESQKTARITSNGSAVTVPLSDFELSDYEFYGKDLFNDFFIDMKLQSVRGRPLPDLVTTEAIAAVLPNTLTELHTTYRYINDAWQVQNVEFYDLDTAQKNTRPFDNIALTNHEAHPDPIVLYSVSDPVFDQPLTQIPYYQRGEIGFQSDTFFKQHEEGHQPWLSGAVDVTTVNCSNLIGPDAILRQTFANQNIEVHTAKELKTKDGVNIKVTEAAGKKSRVEMIVPGLGKYDISLESPNNTSILFVREIAFSPNEATIKRSAVSPSSSILLYSIQDKLNLQPVPKELPDYTSGSVISSPLLSYQEWDNRGGHQPWRREAF